ncbi:MAG TPA: DUF72 domain-containing protein [Polyangiaceae bacterium]|jgi:uncharacterized protein YecE (DUF72 family)
MQIFVGTSGFSYAEWKGRFYPEALPDAQMLRFYSERLPTVEINNTFYQMPKQETVAGWRDASPDAFLFAVKASRRITHQKKLVDVAEDVLYLFNVIDRLGSKVGPVLFQLPPFLKKDLGVLQAFLSALPTGRRAALEFRHPSWFEDDVYEALRAANVALVGGDLEDDEKSPPLVVTADFGYLRLRRMDYDPDSIAEWGARIGMQSWQAVYAYFKHEALGPMFAEALLAVMDGREMADLSAVRASIAAPKPKSSRGPASKKSPGSVPKMPAASVSKAPPRSSKALTEKESKTPAPRSSKTLERASKAPKRQKP